MLGDKSATAGIIIIGNEILSGRTQDVNLSHIAKKLNQHGILIREARIIADIEDVIAETVFHFHKAYDYVFTTGGIGPTHDDITAASVAKAFKRNVEYNEEALGILRSRYGTEDLPTGRKNMARMPVGVKLVANPVTQAPGFQIENVYVMAGIPVIMQAMLDCVLARLDARKPIQSKAIRCNRPEGELAEGLHEVQKQFPEIDIGSYPFMKLGQPGPMTTLVVRGTNEDAISKASEMIANLIISLGDMPVYENEQIL